MLGGHHPDAVYWWNDGEGFASSSYAGPTTARTLNAARSFNSALAADWRERAPQLWPANVPTHCRALERAGRFGTLTLSGAVPSAGAKNLEREKSVIESGGFSDELHASPLFDQLALAFAERLVRADHLGRGKSTDLLAISLSATDYIGHRYGNGGAESCAQLAALDEALGAFFEHLDRLNVPYIVVLTADHGAIDAPERLRPPAQRIDIGAFSAALTRHLREAFALDYDPLAGDDPRQIVFNLRPADDVRRGAMVGDALAWLKKRPEVAAAFTADEIAASTPARGKPARDLTVAERFNESFDRDRSGDILVAYAERSTLGIPHGLGDAVASHGSPWDYDRQVPILWWWPRVVPVAETEPMETVDIAPTLAAIIGVAAPPVDGRCADLGQGCPSSPR
jgi:predicted AlkP superfamily pyrophosphatase or phosphodiesterase